mmetsp:Transcript_2770/g.8143  ORF Transcript_2770/g.8143 Transcript_2770/m.8143 type:complete len:310 (-) Transcript_2770:271-1200(-)
MRLVVRRLRRQRLWHDHELLLGLVLKAMDGRDPRRVMARVSWCTTNTDADVDTHTQATAAAGIIPSLEAHADLDTSGGLGIAHPPQGDEQRPFLGAEGEELDVGHAQDAAASPPGDGAQDAPGIVVGTSPTSASTTNRRRYLLVLDGEQHRLLPHVGAAHVQLKVLVPRRVHPAGVLDPRLVPLRRLAVAVPDGQVRAGRGRQVDVREGFGPEDVQPENALGGHLRLGREADDGGADADGRQAREGVGGSTAAVGVTDPRRVGAGVSSGMSVSSMNSMSSSRRRSSRSRSLAVMIHDALEWSMEVERSQ